MWKMCVCIFIRIGCIDPREYLIVLERDETPTDRTAGSGGGHRPHRCAAPNENTAVCLLAGQVRRHAVEARLEAAGARCGAAGNRKSARGAAAGPVERLAREARDGRKCRIDAAGRAR